MQGAGAADTNDDTSDDETGGVLLYATLQMSTAAGIEAANHTELSLSADALRLLLRESEEGQSSEVLLPVCIVLAASDASRQLEISAVSLPWHRMPSNNA